MTPENEGNISTARLLLGPATQPPRSSHREKKNPSPPGPCLAFRRCLHPQSWCSTKNCATRKGGPRLGGPTLGGQLEPHLGGRSSSSSTRRSSSSRSSTSSARSRGSRPGGTPLVGSSSCGLWWPWTAGTASPQRRSRSRSNSAARRRAAVLGALAAVTAHLGVSGAPMARRLGRRRRP